MGTFSKREAISFGWQTFWAHWKFLLGLLILTFLLPWGPSFLADVLSKRFPLFSLVLGLLTLPFQFLIVLGTIKIYLQLADGQPTKYSVLFSQSRLVIAYLIAGLLSGFIILAGFLLFIIPGIILLIKLQFWPWVMVDQNLGPIEALKTSWRITKGGKFKLWLFNILLALITLVGLLFLGVGLLVAIPVTQLATAFVYRKLSPSLPNL